MKITVIPPPGMDAYECGSLFKMDGNYYLLCQVECNQSKLIGLTGNRYSDTAYPTVNYKVEAGLIPPYFTFVGTLKVEA